MPGAKKSPATTAPPATQLAGFIDKYEPSVAKLARACRSAMRKKLPTANELVYDNYQFLAIGYSSTDRASDSLLSLAVSPKGVSVCFYYGAKLPDPHGILHGGGNQVRFFKLDGAKDLDNPDLLALVRAANEYGRVRLPRSGKGALIIKAISAKQRPRRPAAKTAKTQLRGSG